MATLPDEMTSDFLSVWQDAPVFMVACGASIKVLVSRATRSFDLELGGFAARQFVEEAIGHTPPMTRQHTPNQGRRDWLKKIERNYKKRYYRGKWRGRKAMQSIIQEKQRRVGRMAAGWNAAASLLGAKAPGWVRRHGKKEGRVEVRETSEKFMLTVTDDVPYGKRELRRRAMSVLEGVKRGLNGSMRAIKTKDTPLNEMNPHSLTETLRRFLGERLPGLSVRTPLDNGELLLPYALVEATADSECVPGNRTWEMSVSLELHANAHEQDGAEARYSGSDVVRVLCAAGARKDINEAADDFFLYSLKLAALDRAEVQDDAFIQHAEFRAVVQF